MACKKCGGNAAAYKAAASLPSPTTYTFDQFYPNFGQVEMSQISARQDVDVVLTNNILHLKAGQLTSIPTIIVTSLTEVGAPIWIF